MPDVIVSKAGDTKVPIDIDITASRCTTSYVKFRSAAVARTHNRAGALNFELIIK